MELPKAKHYILLAVAVIAVAGGVYLSKKVEVGKQESEAAVSGILISPSQIASLPTSGAAWTALKAAADASAGSPDITCNQDSRTHPGTALAAGMVYARTGTISYRDKAISLVEAARATTRDCGNAILSLGRQLGAYVLAADFAGYRDAGFVSWVSSIRTRDFPSSHGRWHVLADTAVDSSSNWGTFALASLTVADAYLQDTQGLARDWSLFSFYGTAGGPFSHTSSYQTVWACPEGYPINPASCTDPRKEGAAVEDASRTSFPTLGGYPAESPQGYVVTAEVLSRQGYPAWTVNDAQVCRNAKWRERGSNLNHSSADQYVTWVTNARCGLSQPTKPAGFGRVFGFTDWTHSGLSQPSPTNTSDLNSDGKVDVVDLGILLSAWGQTTKPKADINQDGKVDVVDLGILLGKWGTSG